MCTTLQTILPALLVDRQIRKCLKYLGKRVIKKNNKKARINVCPDKSVFFLILPEILHPTINALAMLIF
jgi:hypothetical protein